MRTIRRAVFLAVAAGFLWAAGSGVAQQTGTAGLTRGVTQAELAQMLVNVLGLARFLPASPSDIECIQILMDNNISPWGGWKPEELVRLNDLARVVVQAMKRQSEVENPDDPQSYIDFLNSIGVSIGTVGEAVDSLEPLAEPVAPHVIQLAATTDPLKKGKTGEPDETEYGTDMEFVAGVRPVTYAEVVRVIREAEFVPRKKKKKPVTPDGE